MANYPLHGIEHNTDVYEIFHETILDLGNVVINQTGAQSIPGIISRMSTIITGTPSGSEFDKKVFVHNFRTCSGPNSFLYNTPVSATIIIGEFGGEGVYENYYVLIPGYKLIIKSNNTIECMPVLYDIDDIILDSSITYDTDTKNALVKALANGADMLLFANSEILRLNNYMYIPANSAPTKISIKGFFKATHNIGDTLVCQFLIANSQGVITRKEVAFNYQSNGLNIIFR